MKTHNTLTPDAATFRPQYWRVDNFTTVRSCGRSQTFLGTTPAEFRAMASDLEMEIARKSRTVSTLRGLIATLESDKPEIDKPFECSPRAIYHD